MSVSKKSIQLTVNGQTVGAEVEPRLQLAEFLREHLLLTGTHLGCEHGVCGACTVELDGAPARSCITYAVACSGATVRTIEGYDEDAVMAALREAFSAEHALQCGYCTPGMLVTARDIVLRLPNADEARIRKELAGNLCRCTGYVGIVRAIQRVLSERGGQEITSAARVSTFDAASPGSARTDFDAAQAPSETVRGNPLNPGRSAAAQDPPRVAESKDERLKPAATLRQSFTVNHAREKVWAFFGRLDQVTSCLPGASVIGTPAENTVDTRLRVKLGPIVAEFQGTAKASRDLSNYSGTIHGSARDARSSSTTKGEIHYALHDENGGAGTRVEVEVLYTLTGTLAQFGRSGLVQDIARRMTAAFAQNLEARLNEPAESPGSGHVAARSAELDAGSLVFSAVWGRIRAFLRRLMRR